MALLTIEELRSHVRVIGTHDDETLEAMLVSAADAAAAFLNRTIYETQQLMDTALGLLADEMAAAQAEYDSAVLAAKDETDCAKRETMLSIAAMKITRAHRTETWAINGVVANGSILASIKLTVGHLFENRESVVAGVGATEIPAGAIAMLRPYRRVMMP